MEKIGDILRLIPNHDFPTAQLELSAEQSPLLKLTPHQILLLSNVALEYSGVRNSLQKIPTLMFYCMQAADGILEAKVWARIYCTCIDGGPQRLASLYYLPYRRWIKQRNRGGTVSKTSLALEGIRQGIIFQNERLARDLLPVQLTLREILQNYLVQIISYPDLEDLINECFEIAVNNSLSGEAVTTFYTVVADVNGKSDWTESQLIRKLSEITEPVVEG